MAELFCAGVTHHPGFAFPDENMADILRRRLQSDLLPTEMRDPRNWPPEMVRQFGVNGEHATASAAEHRDRVMGAYRKVRDAIDEFAPDFILIWGDDQYENFREDLVPPFCISICDQFDTRPFMREGQPENVWQEPQDKVFTISGHASAARYLTRQLLERDYPIPYAYAPLHAQGLSHSFINTVMYLDYERKGFGYPIIPFHVNCYGSVVVRNRGGGFAGSEAELDPPAPSPRLCFEVGAEIARILKQSPWRAVLIGSSSWSHAGLTAKHHYLFPDVESDRKRFEDLRDGREGTWKDLSLTELESAGQQELLNWICLAGALSELNQHFEVLDFSDTFIFNSSKCTGISR